MTHNPPFPDLREPRTVVWVTGASKGIGREIALRFASVGCFVALTARTTGGLARLKREIISLGGYADIYPCDLARRDAVFRVARRIERSAGMVDILVNNAGTTNFTTFRRTSARDLERTVSVNLSGAMYAMKAVYSSMAKRRRGWIINVLSTAAIKTFTGSSVYSGTKAALRAMAGVLREEARPFNVRVTNVYPGATATRMWSREELKKYSKRMMSPRSVSEVILSIYRMPSDVVVEEIVLRPIRGDIE